MVGALFSLSSGNPAAVPERELANFPNILSMNILAQEALGRHGAKTGWRDTLNPFTMETLAANWNSNQIIGSTCSRFSFAGAYTAASTNAYGICADAAIDQGMLSSMGGRRAFRYTDDDGADPYLLNLGIAPSQRADFLKADIGIGAKVPSTTWASYPEFQNDNGVSKDGLPSDLPNSNLVMTDSLSPGAVSVNKESTVITRRNANAVEIGLTSASSAR